MLSSNVAPILKHWKLVGVTLMVLVVGILGNLAAGATPAEAAVIIDVGPGQTFTTIQLGYAAAADGDTLLIHDGVYSVSDFLVHPTTNVTFKAENVGGAIIDGGPGSARTLGGCRIVPLGRKGAIDALWICREAAAMAPPLAVAPGERRRWDGRFDVTLGPGGPGGRSRAAKAWPKVMLGGLGRVGWTEVVKASPELRSAPIPAPARPGLPALIDGKGVLAVPHLGYRRHSKKAGSVDVAEIFFAPAQTLAGGGFVVV